MTILPKPFEDRSFEGPGGFPITLLMAITFVVTTSVAAFFFEELAAILPMTLVFAVCVLVTSRRLRPLSLSPVFYFAGYVALLGVFGAVFTNALVGSGGTGGVDVPLTPHVASATANALLGGAAVVLVAGAVVRGRIKTNAADSAFDLGDVSRYTGWLLLFGSLELFALISYLGIDNLLERENRLVGRDSSIETVIAMAAIGAVVAVGIAFFSSKGGSRVYATLLLLGFVGYFVSMGTRRLAIVPLLILLAYAIARRGRISLLAASTLVVLSVALLSLPLYFRGQPTHGLLPYLQALPDYAYSSDRFFSSLNNFLAGFKITALTGLLAPSIPINVLGISLNPISGDSAGWYDVARTLRLNQFTPYSALGELLNYGDAVFIAVMAGLGLALGVVQRYNDRLIREKLGKIVVILALGLVFIFVIQSGQYNLRSIARYLYLALAIQFIASFAIAAENQLSRRSIRLRSSGSNGAIHAHSPARGH